jgi:hypothetical protein
MEIDDHCNVNVLYSDNKPDLWDCTFCFQKFESSYRLRRHLILDHFAEKMCHDYCIESGLLGDGYSCVICSSSEILPLEELLIHMGIGHQLLAIYLPDNLRSRLQ